LPSQPSLPAAVRSGRPRALIQFLCCQDKCYLPKALCVFQEMLTEIEILIQFGIFGVGILGTARSAIRSLGAVSEGPLRVETGIWEV
jgi:hypothetical protein